MSIVAAHMAVPTTSKPLTREAGHLCVCVVWCVCFSFFCVSHEDREERAGRRGGQTPTSRHTNPEHDHQHDDEDTMLISIIIIIIIIMRVSIESEAAKRRMQQGEAADRVHCEDGEEEGRRRRCAAHGRARGVHRGRGRGAGDGARGLCGGGDHGGL